MSYLEKLLGDSADKHTESMAAAHSQLEQLHGRLSACEKHGPVLSELRKAHANLSSEKAALAKHHASTAERLDFLEKTLGDSADKHAAQLEALKTTIGKHAEVVAKHAKDMETIKSAHAHHATLGERVDYLEKMMGDSADKHTEELE